MRFELELFTINRHIVQRLKEKYESFDILEDSYWRIFWVITLVMADCIVIYIESAHLEGKFRLIAFL